MPLGMKAIAQALQLVPSTCLHILRALLEEELVRVDPTTKRYSMGPGMLPLARSAIRSGSFANLAQPLLEQMTARYGVSAMGVEVSGLRHIVVAALSPSALPVRLHVELGSRFPALISATGRCIAAFGGYPNSEIEKKFRSLRWQTAVNFESWMKEVESVKKLGFSVDRGNYIDGVTIVAVPVFNSKKQMVYGIAAVGVLKQLEGPICQAIARDMQAQARILSSQLISLA